MRQMGERRTRLRLSKCRQELNRTDCWRALDDMFVNFIWCWYNKKAISAFMHENNMVIFVSERLHSTSVVTRSYEIRQKTKSLVVKLLQLSRWGMLRAESSQGRHMNCCCSQLKSEISTTFELLLFSIEIWIFCPLASRLQSCWWKISWQHYRSSILGN